MQPLQAYCVHAPRPERPFVRRRSQQLHLFEQRTLLGLGFARDIHNDVDAELEVAAAAERDALIV